MARPCVRTPSGDYRRTFNPRPVIRGDVVDRRTAATALLAVLAVLALGVAAATLDSATSTSDGGGFGAGSSEDDRGVGSDQRGSVDLGGNASASQTRFQLSLCVEVLTRPLVQLALLGAVALFFLAVYRTTGSKVLSAIFVSSACFPFTIVYFLLVSCGNSPSAVAVAAGDRAANRTGFGVGGGDAGMNATGEALSTPTTLVGILLVLALVGSVALLFVSTGDDDRDLAEEEPDLPPAERRAAVGAAAGAAADRLEDDAALGNEVYRAWSEMTGLLDVENSAASTPDEFAEVAVAAGMDREDVTALTDVFEEVRYGGADPTPEREGRAVSALRHIEETYADGDTDAEDVASR